MIIDVHAHVFIRPRVKFAPHGEMVMTVEEQIAVMDERGIDKAVILPIYSHGPGAGENQGIGEVLHICGEYPGRFVPFCNFSPLLPIDPEKIRVEDFDFLISQFKELGCKGLGEIVQRMYFDDPIVLALFESCQKHDMPITIHTTSPDFNSYGLMDEVGFPRFEKVLGMFPDLNFLGHSCAFWSEIGGGLTLEEKNDYPMGTVKPGGAIKRLMRGYENLYCDMSAGSGLNALTRDVEHAYEFIDEFQDRLMFGRDACSALQGREFKHSEWLTAARDEGRISDEAYEKIMWKNVNRVLKLGLER